MARKNEFSNDLWNLGSKAVSIYNPVAGLVVETIRALNKHFSNNDSEENIPEERIKNYKIHALSLQSFREIVNENKVPGATEVYARKQRAQNVYTITLVYGKNSESLPPKKNNYVVIIADTLDDDIYNKFDDDDLIVIRINCPKQGVSITDVFERVRQITVDKLGVDEEKVTLAASFTNDLGADTLDCVELAIKIECEFNIDIPDDVLEEIVTFGDMVKYIEKQILQQARRVQISGI